MQLSSYIIAEQSLKEPSTNGQSSVNFSPSDSQCSSTWRTINYSDAGCQNLFMPPNKYGNILKQKTYLRKHNCFLFIDRILERSSKSGRSAKWGGVRFEEPDCASFDFVGSPRSQHRTRPRNFSSLWMDSRNVRGNYQQVSSCLRKRLAQCIQQVQRKASSSGEQFCHCFSFYLQIDAKILPSGHSPRS